MKKQVSVLENITDLRRVGPDGREQAANLLVAGFARDWPDAWPDLESAAREVDESLGEGRISRVALDREGRVIGWIGGISQYGGRSWELHPLVVHPDLQSTGIGTALVGDLESRVRATGAQTIWLLSDDEGAMTSVGGRDLYPDVLGKLAAIRNLRGHPFEFYRKVGYTIVGIIPDASGPGKPDILMAKRVGGQQRTGAP